MQDDRVVEYDGFKMFVADASVPWLSEAMIDFEEDETGGQLTIKAPGIKGTAPSSGDSLEERVGWLHRDRDQSFTGITRWPRRPGGNYR